MRWTRPLPVLVQLCAAGAWLLHPVRAVFPAPLPGLLCAVLALGGLACAASARPLRMVGLVLAVTIGLGCTAGLVLEGAGGFADPDAGLRVAVQLGTLAGQLLVLGALLLDGKPEAGLPGGRPVV